MRPIHTVLSAALLCLLAASAAARQPDTAAAAATPSEIDAEVSRLMRAGRVPAWPWPSSALAIHFEPGSRYAYSGEGISLLQFVLERGAEIDVGRLMRARVFDHFGMRRTGMTWRDDFAGNLAHGYDEKGGRIEQDRRESVRAAGSMDTTISDYAHFLTGLVRGEGLSDRGCDPL